MYTSKHQFAWHQAVKAYIISQHLKEIHMGESNHDIIKRAFETYIEENTKFTEKKVKASAARARKALQELTKAIKERRKEITTEKEALAK